MRQAPFLQSLTQRLTNLRRRYKALRRKGLSKTGGEGHRGQMIPNAVTKLVRYYLRIYTSGVGKIQKRSPVIFAVAVVSLTGVMGYKLYHQPQLKVGKPAVATIEAPYTDTIEDKYKTQTQRNVASKTSVPVLMIDTNINHTINQKLQATLEQGNEIRSIAGSFPYTETLALSISTQQYLRSTSPQEWESLKFAIINSHGRKTGTLAQVDESKTVTEVSKKPKQTNNCNIPPCLDKPQNSELQVPSNNLENIATSSKKTVLNPQKHLSPQKTAQIPDLQNSSVNFTQALAEIETYRLTATEENISALIESISLARQRYAAATAKIAELVSYNPQSVYKDTLILDLHDDEWTKTQTNIEQIAERILTQGIPPGLPRNVLEDAVRLNLELSLSQEAEPLGTRLLLDSLQPNLKKDEQKTQIQAKEAADEVQPVMVLVQKGTVIVRQGQPVTNWDFQVLEHYGLIDHEVNWLGLTILAVGVSGALVIFAIVEMRVNYRKKQRDHLLILLLTLSVPLLLAMGIPYTTWSTVGLLLGSFYGSTVSVTVVGLLVVLIAFSMKISKIALISGASGAFLGGCMAHKLRSREELALLGIGIALTEGGVYLIFKILVGTVFHGQWYAVFKEALFFACSGLIWSVVALGLSPYLEQLFDLVTPIRLAELANPNRSLLKRLAAETPGTFQHTLFVSSLAEAAARKLECNVELVRAGTLYHDIGKMHDSQAFIENQMGGPNKHDTEIKNPWVSAEIIKTHVSEGLAMARKHRLPTAIQAFIPEHQGTMQIAYFYHQAQQLAKENPDIVVDKADFTYDGPIPQSRETAIVMLADSCEAALRSLKEATPEQALAMVNNILRARWQENQLIDSGLTRAQISQIAQIFVEVWQQFHHKRIAYPKLKANTGDTNK